LIFLCDVHTGVIDEEVHPITDAERIELDRRREASRRALAGQLWERPQPLNRR
jgi:hypothetical protein